MLLAQNSNASAQLEQLAEHVSWTPEMNVPIILVSMVVALTRLATMTAPVTPSGVARTVMFLTRLHLVVLIRPMEYTLTPLVRKIIKSVLRIVALKRRETTFAIKSATPTPVTMMGAIVGLASTPGSHVM